MAGEGLFFTGQVLTNNRDLLEEEATRQQLDMQREELELKKQAAADKRKEARKKNEVDPNSYSLDEMDPFLQEQFQGEVSDYQGFVIENSLNFDDNIELKNQKLKNEGNLNISGGRYRSISTDLTSYQNLIKNGKGDKLALAEDGSYLYDYNYKKIQEEVNKRKANPDEGMTFDEAMEAYPIDADTVMKRTEWVDPTIALFATDNANRKGTYDNEDDGYKYKTISNSQKNITQTAIKNKLTVNSQGFHNDPNYKRIYDTKLLTIEGNEMTAKEAFFLEAYVDPETGERAEITDATNLLDILDSESDNFNKDASNAYAEYLAKKISDQGYKDMTDERDGKIQGETSAQKKAREAEEDQMEYNVDTAKIISSSKPGDEANTGYQTYYGHPKLAKDLTKGIKSDSPLSAILNPSSDQAIAFKKMAQASMKDATTMEFDVISITLDSNGLPVALIQIPNNPNSKAFIPYSRLSSKTIEMLGDDVKNIVNYKQPEVKFDPNSHSNT
tara:strand:+ start:626 stop:2128 length:1503 start_codon:yes stop_codon:yes gene_type:complete